MIRLSVQYAIYIQRDWFPFLLDPFLQGTSATTNFPKRIVRRAAIQRKASLAGVQSSGLVSLRCYPVNAPRTSFGLHITVGGERTGPSMSLLICRNQKSTLRKQSPVAGYATHIRRCVASQPLDL